MVDAGAVTKSGVVLTHGPNDKREPGRVHEELHAPCGCAFHQRPAPHWHPCPLHAAADAAQAENAGLREDALHLQQVREWADRASDDATLTAQLQDSSYHTGYKNALDTVVSMIDAARRKADEGKDGL